MIPFSFQGVLTVTDTYWVKFYPQLMTEYIRKKKKTLTRLCDFPNLQGAEKLIPQQTKDFHEEAQRNLLIILVWLHFNKQKILILS